MQASMNKKYIFTLLIICYVLIGRGQSSQPSNEPDVINKRWQAQWITVPGASIDGYGVYLFRKAIDLPAKPNKFIVHVSADNRYKLYINNQLVSMGPARGDISHWNYETVDISSYLKAGQQDKPGTRLILEIKPTDIKTAERRDLIARSVLRAVQQAGVEAYTEYISFDYDQLIVLKQLQNNAKAHYLNGDRSPEQVAKDGIDGIDYNFSVFQKNPDWIAQAKRLKLILNAWTVNDMAMLDWFLEQGFDFITTNEPELLFERVK